MTNLVSSVAEATLLQVRVEPDSSEMKAQSVLKACSVSGRYFTFGRRGSRRYVSAETNVPDHRIANPYPYTISRQHCELERMETQVMVRDLNSRLGTVVNGRRLGCRKGQQSEIALGPGEHSLVLGRSQGEVRFKLVISAP